MQESLIMSQIFDIKEVNRNNATHFVLCDGDRIRYLVELKKGRRKLGNNISAYSKKLELLMKNFQWIPFVVLKMLGLGFYAKIRLKAPVKEYCAHYKYWNAIIGTYDERQKIVFQCFNSESQLCDFIKVGNQSTRNEMSTEIDFLKENIQFNTFKCPELIDGIILSDLNIQITREFFGEKVAPVLSDAIISIYEEISMYRSDAAGHTFSHGDFAPWNLKYGHEGYTVFDWEHCGYRIPGYDLMHFQTLIEMVINKRDYISAKKEALSVIKTKISGFEIDIDEFSSEFEKTVTELRK